MNHALQLTFALLFAALTIGCPGRAPDSTAFAADGGHNDATGGIASDVPAVNDTQTGDSQTADAGPGAADVSTADGGSTPSGVCSGPLPKIFVKTFDSGASERGYGIARHSTGYVIAAEVGDGSYKRQAQLRSISNAGIPQWAKTYGKGGGDETARAVVALKDGFAFAGETNTQGAGSYDGWLVRTDSNGKELWQKTFGGEKTDRFAGLAARKPGGFVAAGTNRSIKGAQEDGWMVATDANGDELWAYGYGGSHIDELFAVVANGDGFAAVGENWSDATSGTDAWLLLVDAKGKTVHSRVYGYGDKDYARGLARTTDGFILTGKASDKGNPKLWIIRTDLTGTQQWARIRGANQSEAGFDVGVWADDSFVIVGDTNSGTTGTDAWLLRYDRWGNSQWDKRLGGAGNQWGTGVLANADGTVTMVGRDYNNKTKSDILLARVGPWGYSDCQKAASCGKRSLAECDDNNPCTIDGCDTIDGCTNTPAKAGTSCAVGKICAGKVCTGG